MIAARAVLASCSLCLPLLCAAPARAQSVDAGTMQPSAGMVRVHVTAGEHPFLVYFGRGEEPIADCAAACEFWAWPGKYRVRVFQGEGPRNDSQLALRVGQAGRYELVPANGTAQNAGLVLGVSGPVIGIAGLVLTLLGAGAGDQPASLYVGLGGLGLGAGMTGVGWLLYAENRATFDFSARVGPQPLAGGLGFGATLTF